MTNNANPPAETRPLQRVRVLDLTTGPMAAISRQLAELGADVIRLEPEGGAKDRLDGHLVEGVSIDWVAANLGKRCSDIGQLDGLLPKADIVVAHRGEVDARGLLAAHHKLVILTIADFGDTDGYRSWRGSGPVYHALSGELARSGIPGREPLLPPGDLAIQCAIVQAVWSIMIAYWNALKTGAGDHLDFSVLDGVTQALDPGFGIGGSATAGVSASKLPRGRPEARFMYPIIPCKDGFVRICVLAPRQWRSMFKWLGEPEEFADPSFENLVVRFKSKALIPAIAAFFANKTRAQLEAEAEQFGIPAAGLLDLDEAMQTDQMKARKPFKSIEVTTGIHVPFPDGLMEIDGKRMGISGPPMPVRPAPIDWLQRERQLPPSNDAERPLSGIRVLDFGVIVVGGEAGRMLADQGADVIKIESSKFPDGSRQTRGSELISTSFAAGHRNKRSLGLDLRSEDGKKLILDLVGKADVVLSNFKGGTLKSLGLDFATLKKVNPSIIVTDCSAFGPTGPWSRRMGYGPLVRASAGLTKQWRYPGEPDSFSDAITIYPDHVAGRIVAIGVLALLVRRLNTGTGGEIGISQAEVMLSQLGAQIAVNTARQQGYDVQPPSVRSEVIRCAGEDEWCVLTLDGDADEEALSKLVGPAGISAWAATRGPIEVMNSLQNAGLAAGAMLRVAELPEFEYYRNRAFFRISDHPHTPGACPIENAPVRSLLLDDPPESPAPLPGEQTREIAKEIFGLSDNEQQSLFDKGVLEEPDI